MTNLKLGKLPDRTPVKITIMLDPEVMTALQDYCEIYKQNFGEAVSPKEIIPYMIHQFMNDDGGFKKARKLMV